MTSYLEIMTATPTTMSQWAAFSLGGERVKSTSMVSTVASNEITLICSFSPFIGCLVNRPGSYSCNLVNSWPRNWKNQFPTCMGGLTDKLQYQLRDHIFACFTAPTYLVVCRSAIPTGGWVLVWEWINKFFARLTLCQNNVA